MAERSRPKHSFLIAGTHSGCGKTTVSLGLMAAFRARGLRVQPFKVGPDFIDPGLHAQISGTESRNLDGWMLGRSYNTGLFRRLLEGADLGIVEGVMGLFDGYEGGSESGSSAEMAKWLDIPAVLVVDARSMARSAAALVHGFTSFDPALRICGVIFNNIGGPAHLEYLKEALGSTLPGTAVIGGIPREDPIRIPERHLGLVTADEMKLSESYRDRLAGLIERNLDADLLLSLTRYGDATGPAGQATAAEGSGPIIGVARDAAFCFYYPDNFELLRSAGARLRFFSPVAGESIPGECSGLYLGGGYPELFAGAISENSGFLGAVRDLASRGMPIYAECGGLMSLGRYIESTDGKRFPMAGVFPFGTRMLSRRKALGYTEVVLRRECLLGGPGRTIRGHEFHYSEIAGAGEDPGVPLAYELRGRKHESERPEGFQAGSVLASYVHLHWGSCPEAAVSFVEHCARWENGL
ncbi:MAG: cobyrinate a,c-diamide synthase [Desulfobacteraceae bacterium]|nr:cobyrinate a,c-diamide synthase [Desulfobacteraceae bacterium]